MAPISGAAYGKLLIYAISVLPTVVFIPNIIPVIFIIFGLYMTKKTRDFSHINAAGRNVYLYIWIIFLILVCIFIYQVYQLTISSYMSFSDDEVVIPGAVALSTVLYLLATKYWFIVPLREHRQWIEVHGIFPNRSTRKVDDSSQGIRLFSSSRFKQYSVADELSKWSKLHEEGRIDAAEFDQIKRRLMGQM